MAELGIFGPTLPVEYGGMGINNIAYGLIMQELERGDSGVRSFASVQSALVMYPIYTFGSEEQRKKYLPKLAKGEFIGCFGLTEPDFGSNPGGMITKAEKTDGGYILNGAKMWITNGTIADVAVVWAKLDGKVRGFLVDKGTKGFSAPEMKGKLSLRASITSELVFEDCFIPEENLLAKQRRIEISFDVSYTGKIRNCMGSCRHCNGMLQYCIELFFVKNSIRKADCIISDHTGKTCIHAY